MTTPATGSPPPELRAAAERFESAWDGDDPDAVARFFTEDATASVADVTLSGRDDIAAGWIAPAVPIISRLRLMEDSIRPGGDGWRSDGTYTHDATLPGAETVRDHRGRYSFTWTREAHGDWLIRSFQVHPDQLGGAGGLGGARGAGFPMTGAPGDAAIPVLAAVIRRGDHYLLARRPAHKRHGGLWEFPGGKLEPGESWLDAARRELREELDVDVVAVGEPVHRRRDPGSPFQIVFVEVEMEGEARATEHDELRWVVVGELARLELAPADAAFAARLRGDGGEGGRAPE
jgi:8-oxo-dGTP diphosphatase